LRCKEFHPLLALHPAKVIFAANVPVGHHRIADDEADIGRQWQQFELKRPAIEKQGVSRAAVRRRELIHDSTPCSDRLILRALAKFREINTVKSRFPAPIA
jgi:hypothetical protein